MNETKQKQSLPLNGIEATSTTIIIRNTDVIHDWADFVGVLLIMNIEKSILVVLAGVYDTNCIINIWH